MIKRCDRKVSAAVSDEAKPAKQRERKRFSFLPGKIKLLPSVVNHPQTRLKNTSSPAGLSEFLLTLSI